MTIAKYKSKSPILAEFYRKGWTLTPAAERLGVHRSHLHRVLIGERQSPPLVARIRKLPPRETP